MINQAGYKILYGSVHKQKDSTTLIVACFPNPPKNCKKGVIVAYGVLRSTKVQCDLFCQKSKCDVLRQKKIFPDARSHASFSPRR